ncbi:MAG TPA: DNA polymerase Y family protein [Methylomirabilota bacterium]|nr:DNA polymerase Y family protein [Methylomirabilota bacterium]
MSSPGGRVACVWVPFFAAAAAERGEPVLAERALAIVRGAPPVTRVVEANAIAREAGVRPRMTESEARARCPDLVCRALGEETLVSAQHALVEAALAVSPRVEDTAPGLVHADVAGLQRLFGDDGAVAERLVRQARMVGLAARAGVASSRTVAGVAVRATSRRVAVVPPGGERAVLATAPLAVLDLPATTAATLGRWGVRTLGELAALPRAGLAERLGQEGLRLHDLACGHDRDPFRPYVPPPFWEEAQDLDWEIEDLQMLAVVLDRVLERLTARLGAAHVWADRLDLRLRLTTGERHERAIALAQPACERAVLVPLIRCELAARPPAAAVTAVAVSARVVPVAPGQGQLGQPPAPRQRDLAALVAHLTELVGPDNFGSPRLVDSHHPDPVTLVPFVPTEEGDRAGAAPVSSVVLRRIRPPVRVQVVAAADHPASVQWAGVGRRVVACAGPWRVSGEWWDGRAWARDEWDLLLDDGTLCRLALDRMANHWVLDGIYD